MAYLHVENLHVRIGIGSTAVHAVRGVTLMIERGEIHGLAGESGSGKTMTCRTLLGLVPQPAEVTAERLEFDGLDLVRADWRTIRGARIAMIPQDPAAALNPIYRIRYQMERVLTAHTKLNRRGRLARVIRLLEDVGLPDPQRVMALYPHQMSGGMQQRALIAMALAAGADLLIADEATTALDVTVQAQFLHLLATLRRRYGLTVIFITHDLALLTDFCDRASVMQRGRIVESGTVAALSRTPGHPYTQALLAALPGNTGGACGSRPPRRLSSRIPWAEPVRLEVERLNKSFELPGGVLRKQRIGVLRDVTVSIASGEVLGLVGESGSGKTTLARCIMGIIRPDSGAVRLDGVDAAGLGRRALRQWRRDMAVVYQNPFLSLNPTMTVQEIVAEPILVRERISRAGLRNRISEFLGDVGLESSLFGRRVGALSGGQAQRVAIARAIATRPRLIILDEPSSSLDVRVQAQILNLLVDLQERDGFSCLFITMISMSSVSRPIGWPFWKRAPLSRKAIPRGCLPRPGIPIRRVSSPRPRAYAPAWKGREAVWIGPEPGAKGAFRVNTGQRSGSSCLPRADRGR